jgi:amino acid adenylation domain-containing protein
MLDAISDTEGHGGLHLSESGPAWSCSQERNWFLEQAYPGHAQHRHAIGARIAGPLDIETLRTALACVCSRHDVLQRGFGAGTKAAAGSPTLTIDSIAPGPADARAHWIAERSNAAFSPAGEPMLRAHLLRIAADEHLLLLVAHRYLLDEDGLLLLLGDIAASLAGTLPAGPASPRFTEFVRAQRNNPQQAELITHWRTRLAGAAPVLELPIDHPRPAIQAYGGATLPVDLPAGLTARLHNLAKRHGVDLQAVLLAAFATLLQRHSGQGDLVIGLRSSYRCDPALARLVGPLDNTLALRLDLSADPSSDALLQLASSALDDARRHAALPFEQLIEALQPARNLGYAPICQVLFDYRVAPPAQLTAGELTLQPFSVKSATTAHDLGLRIDEQGDQLSGRLIYDPALFSAATASRMAGHYRSLLDDLASDAPKPASALQLLTAAEWQQLVVDWNATDAAYPADSSLSRLFEAQAERTPDAPAILGPGPALSYRELDERANRLAHHLASLGVAHETLVGVSMERSPELFVAVLAILKAGACYVPLDPGYPAARLTAMLEDTAVSLLLSKERWLDVLPPHKAQVLCLDRDWPAIAARPASRPASLAGAASLAYVVFTSGSTGRPKGVMVEQRQLLNRFAWMWREYPFAPGDVSACKTALNFVDSLWELLGPLLHGVPSLLVAQPLLLEPRAFVALLAEYRVTRMMLVPSLMRMMLDAHDDLAARLPLLRDWCIGGEPLTVELARRFARAMPGRLLLNLYGLSEAFDACYFDAGQLTDADTLVPIGRPLSNVQAYVLDSHRQPVPVGVIGELYVGGAGLARGYLGQPAMSAEKFLPNPFRDVPGSRIYRTGDLARLRPDGLIDYLGRSDHQVKIRGFRIEPDEVASVLRSHPDIAQAVVVARPDDTGELALAAYFVARDSTPAIAPLQGWLRERLPDYMVPASYTPLAALPMTPSGKVDRLSLPAPDKRSAVASAYVAPADETEQIIARLWQDVLQIERVGSQDNFFDLGGTSLRMVQINRRLCDALQRTIPVLQMYQHPTVSSLARSLAADSSIAPASSAAQAGRERAGLRRDMLARRQTTARRSPG